MSDDVLARFRAGDHAAVSALYTAYGAACYTVAMSILRDREQAADAVQQTFVKAWRSAASYDPDREFAPWIYAIARNTAIDIHRADKRREKPTLSGDIEVADMSKGFESVWEAFEVRIAIEQLPEEEKTVVRLTHLEGFTHSQAAEKLGVAVGTIKSRSHRAHQRLAAWLRHLWEE